MTCIPVRGDASRIGSHFGTQPPIPRILWHAHRVMGEYGTRLLTQEEGRLFGPTREGDDLVAKSGRKARGTGTGIVRASWYNLRKDRELILLPVLGGFVAALAAVPVSLVAFFTARDGKAWGYAMGGVGLLVTTFIITLFAVAFAAGANERLDGGDPTLRSCLSDAWSRKRAILQWPLFAAIVGTVLRMLRERAGIARKVVAGLGGLAWGVATYFVIPILACTRTSGRSATRESAQLMRAKWGGALRVQLRLGLFAVAWLISAVAAGFGVSALAQTSTAIAAGVGAVAVILLVYASLMLSVLGAYARVALWRYATDRPVPGFDKDRLEAAVRTRPAAP